jgi:hypothetical protein
VPCFQGRITPSYWPWLEAYDPDIVYSYVPLTRTGVLEVHERLSPAEYTFHKLAPEPRLDVFGFKPSYQFEFKPLSSLSIIFRLARYSLASRQGAPVVGAGGGSIGFVDTGGLLKVGPRSAGADPGPACYDHGNEEPTVTDANIVFRQRTQRPRGRTRKTP